MIPAARCGLGVSRSSVMAAATIAMLARFIIPVTSRTAMKPEQHKQQCRPRRSPYCQAYPAFGDVDPARVCVSRQQSSW